MARQFLQFDASGTLATNQAAADAFLASIKTILGYGGANPQKTTDYATKFTYNTNFCRVEILDAVYPLLTAPQQAKVFEDFQTLCTLTAPAVGQAYQRNGSDQANIVIKGTYAGTRSGALEASFNGGSYVQVSPGLTGGPFTLTLPAQVGGQGTFTIRPVADPTASKTVADVLISDVFLILGQSNHGEQATNNKNYTGTGKAVVWNKATRRSRWANMSGSDGTTQAYWPLFGNSFAASQGRACGFIAVAVGGTDVELWQKASLINYVDPNGNDPFGSGLYNLYNRALAAIAESSCGGVKAAFWHQGEADAIAGTTEATYEAKLAQLASDLNADLGITTGVAKLQVIKTEANTVISTTAINTAIADLWVAGGNIWQGPDFTDITSDGPEVGFGYVHLKNDTSVAAQGSRWWTAAQAKFSYA